MLRKRLLAGRCQCCYLSSTAHQLWWRHRAVFAVKSRQICHEPKMFSIDCKCLGQGSQLARIENTNNFEQGSR